CAAVIVLAIAALLAAREHSPRAFGLASGALAATLLLGVLAMMPILRPAPVQRIANPALPPATMTDEAMGGEQGPFFPSSVHTSTNGRIPSKFFLGSEGCGRVGCHPPADGSGAACEDVPQAVPWPAARRVLLVVPQGASRQAGERLPLDPRLQRLRRVAGVGRVGPGRARLLLSREVRRLRRLP